MDKPFSAYRGDDPYVFVCYAHEDDDVVYPEIAWLREQNINLWYDEGISAGKNWLAAIGDSLLGARQVLCYISERSLESDHCNREINLALTEGKDVVPIYLEYVELTSDLKVGLSRVQALHREQDRNYQQHLLGALGKTTEPARPMPPPKRKQDTPAVPSNAVQGVVEGEADEILAKREQSSPRPTSWIVALAIGLAVGAIAMYSFNQSGERPGSPTPRVRVSLELDGWEDWKFDIDPTPSMVISTDGNTVVFVARDSDGTSSLRVRQLGGIDTIDLVGTEGARQPFFSPDDHWIGYFDSGLMKRVSLRGGDPSVITNVEGQTFGASWGPDDRIYYTEGRSGLKSVSVSGEDPKVVTQLNLDRGEIAHRLTNHIPGSQGLLLSIFIGRGSQPKHEIWVLNLATSERHYLMDGLAPAYIDSGHIVYAKAEIGLERSQEVMGGSLWAVPFDAESMLLTGLPRSVQNAVAGREGSAYAVARSGTLIYLPSQGKTVGELVLLESSGSRVLAEGPMFRHPQFSNDGKSIAVAATEEGKTPSIWIYGIESGAISQFSDGARFPLWDPDDQGITFMKVGVGLVRQRLDSTKSAETLVHHKGYVVPDGWINQGRTLLYHSSSGTFDYTVEFDDEPNQILERELGFPSLTIDNRWIAFCTWPRGVRVGSFPDITSVSIATDSGCTPHWGDDDTRLYFQDFNQLWAVNVSFTEGVAFGKRESIVDLGYPGISLFDMDKGGRIIIARTKDTAPKPPVVMMHWASMLE